MAGITQKSCVALFPLRSLKKNFLFLFSEGGGRADVNQQKLTKKNQKFKFDKKSCWYYDSCNSNYYLIDNKYKNCSYNNRDYH